MVGKTKCGKGAKLVVLADGAGAPIGICMASASPSETKLLEAALETVAVKREGPGRPRKRPERLIADRGYDSNLVRASLAARGIEPIIPARRNNTVAPHQDGRRLRRYRRRRLVEGRFCLLAPISYNSRESSVMNSLRWLPYHWMAPIKECA